MPRVNVLCVHAWVLRVRARKSCMSLRAHAFHVGRHTCARAHICWRIGGKWDSSRFGHDDDCAVTGEKGEGFCVSSYTYTPVICLDVCISTFLHLSASCKTNCIDVHWGTCVCANKVVAEDEEWATVPIKSKKKSSKA